MRDTKSIHRHMSSGKVVLNRRALLLASIGVGFLLYPVYGMADSLTGIDTLDTPSIRLKTPSSVLLVAITRTRSRLVAVGEHGVIIYSDDNGETWSQAQVPVNVTLTCVAFAADGIGWAAGHFGAILKTQDSGATWAVQLNGIQANQLTLTAAQAPAVATDACPCAPLALRRATHFMEEGPDKPFLCLLVLSPQKILAFGAYRMAMLSNDGGASWTDWSLHIYDKYSHNIYDAVTIGDVSYLVAEEGLVFASSDGSNSYLPLAPTSSITLFGVLGAGDGSLIVYGVAGTVFRSTDSGKSWTAITIASQDDITGGRVLESGVIILASEAGSVFKSADNGATFNAIAGITPVPIFDIQEAADGAMIAVGAAGVSAISKDILTA
jgi:photosystem II stability/assembly factor-like uncharacterized protein